jgi:predicted membrane-bound spermidine synthase
MLNGYLNGVYGARVRLVLGGGDAAAARTMTTERGLQPG